MKTVYDLFPEIDEQRKREFYPDIKDEIFWKVFELSKPFSMLSVEGFYNLYRSVQYIARRGIRGDLVECGVFLGGSVLAMSEFAHHFGLGDRKIYLYDTFNGFPEGSSDVDLGGNVLKFVSHSSFFKMDQGDMDEAEVDTLVASKVMATVREALAMSRYQMKNFKLIAGMVEETLLKDKPGQIALLRLDTDYYDSTRVEFEQLYPLLVRGGVLIVDDYGHFEGARKATDEYLQEIGSAPLLNRISYTIRCGVKL